MYDQRPTRTVFACLFSPFLVGVTTWLLYLIQQSAMRNEGGMYVRPYGIGYLLPIATLAILGGRTPALLTLALSVAGLVYVLFEPHFTWIVSHPRDWAELGIMVVTGSLLIFGYEYVGRTAARAAALSTEARDAWGRLEASEEQRRTFNREVLLAVTGGRLLLADKDELHGMVGGPPALNLPLDEIGDSSHLRGELRRLVAAHGLSALRLDDLLTGTMEAATNAIKHGQTGTAQAWFDGDSVSVLISDRGHGIPPSSLAKAMLQRGFSTSSTLGLGFVLMLQTADMLALHTSEAGTDILMRVGSGPLPSEEERLLGHHSGLALGVS